ncbi:hypothetical protein B0H10DRAFT_2102339 [Mycena sp. CBHHK59/15]|nr:hypothetical protein B0H10DRAFT_2102339 [Mycena sp. CBHHK59/15]
MDPMAIYISLLLLPTSAASDCPRTSGNETSKVPEVRPRAKMNSYNDTCSQSAVSTRSPTSCNYVVATYASIPTHT